MINNEDILKIVHLRGPIIPNELKKIIKAGDTILLGAMLSELAIEGKVKITNTKVGSSPAYYTPGTEPRLENLMKYLNEKDRKTAEYLRQKKVLKDSDQSPLVRVSLRNIKDYAKPLEVSIKGQREIYWKWYMTPVKEAQELILKQVKPEKKPLPKAPIKTEIKKEKALQVHEATESKKDSGPPKTKSLGAKDESLSISAKLKEQLKIKKSLKPEEEKQEVQKELGITREELEQEKDVFFKKIKEYLYNNDIDIIDYKIIRKKSDIELSVAVPSRIGSQEYYCKAKSKKKINDGDLSSAYVSGQAKKLPVIFITTGELTKKAKEMLIKDFKGMIMKKI